MNGPVKISHRKLGIAMVAALAAGGCSTIDAHRGYLADPVLTASVQPAIDNRTSVEQTLGRPSFTSQFGAPVWYYVSSETQQKPFNSPKIVAHSVLAVHFDGAGNVATTDRTGIEQVVRLDPDDDETPTLGRDRSFFEDLFGNIGQVGGAVNTGN
jgi:outer membrane protein assembly factor BamE (lipoprotein component of BamABCDE complex)